MRIGIDLHILKNLMQGSRTYMYNLMKGLIEIDQVNDYVLYLPNQSVEQQDSAFDSRNVHRRAVSHGRRAFRLIVEFPSKLSRDRVDIFHCQYMGPLFCPCPYIVTIHDILHETYPEFYPSKLRFLMKYLYPLSARKAACVITGSEYTKKQIQKLYKVPAERIVVTSYAAGCEFRPINDKKKMAEVALRYGVEGPYILFVGRIEPRKNILGLIDAYRSLKARHEIKQKLIIAGMKDPLFQNYYRTVHEQKPGEDVILTGGIAQEDLPYLFSGADLFVYPTFAEGFGLPVLEAMSCGAPVITSKVTSLPEVVGNAGFMIDPGDNEQLVFTMHQALRDQSVRDKMKKDGLSRANLFSWRRTAERTLEIYRTISKNH